MELKDNGILFGFVCRLFENLRSSSIWQFGHETIKQFGILHDLIKMLLRYFQLTKFGLETQPARDEHNLSPS